MSFIVTNVVFLQSMVQTKGVFLTQLLKLLEVLEWPQTQTWVDKKSLGGIFELL